MYGTPHCLPSSVIAPLVEASAAISGSFQRSEMSIKRPASTYGFILVAAYQFTTSGAFAEREFRICVFQPSRSITVSSTLRLGCIASKSEAIFSITARGAGFDISDVIRNVPDNSAYAGTATPVESAKAVVSLINFWNIIFSLLSREVLYSETSSVENTDKHG